MSTHYRIGPFLALLLAVPVLADDTQEFTGKVTKVTDGDTVTVLLDDEEKIRVRLAGIDCPEIKQPFGEQAKEFTEEFCLGKEVKIAASGKDRYGRVLGEVILPDGKILNEELLREGLAWWYRRFAPDNATYEKLEREAREAGRGLWPTPPWEFRNGPAERFPKIEEKEAASAKEKQEAAVYITKTGKKYHRADCPHLSVSKIPLEEAETLYTPCSVCKPPAASTD